MLDLTAILLCGGKGERLRPFTDALPKPLVPIKGHPLLYHLIRYLYANGIRRFVICAGYKAEAVEEFVREYGRPEWQIRCVNSGDVSMTDRLLSARRFVTGPALICYGDTLANVDLNSLYDEHQSSGALATVTIYPLRSPFGIVNLDGSGRVTAFSEKPHLPYWINIGFIICELDAFARIKPQSDIPAFLSELSQAGLLFAHKHNGKHLTVNTEKDRAEAETEMVEFFTLIDGRII